MFSSDNQRESGVTGDVGDHTHTYTHNQTKSSSQKTDVISATAHLLWIVRMDADEVSQGSTEHQHQSSQSLINLHSPPGPCAG